VKPSKVDPFSAKPFTLEQELEPFGKWVGDPIWIPPKDSSKTMAESMLRSASPLTPKAKRWSVVEQTHRKQFTQVREIDLCKDSIRLPKGKFFVSVTEQRDFDKITDSIPACVQTRLDEFMAGPGKRPGVKVYYLKPLCVEVGDDLILTTRADMMAAVKKIQDEVFAEYRRMYLPQRSLEFVKAAVNVASAIPRGVVKHLVGRRQRQIDAYQARLEFKRRKTALSAARTHRKCRTHGCTFDEMLALTNPLERADVIEQYGIEQNLSRAKRDQLMMMAAGSIPWFVALSMGISYVTVLSKVTITFAPPIMVCDPAFIAEMPGSNGVVLKIGHFDEIGGVTHVEI
tara:strand:- start:95011 stop:96039 length:1029 start_codon:yes stop_codon:yes gene_type:complete